MKQITLRLPDGLYKRIFALAKSELRSIQKQMILIIEAGLSVLEKKDEPK
jgi:hypothetical protein